MPHPYTQGQLVEQPAIGLLAQLGWQTVASMEEVFGAGATLSRKTSGDKNRLLSSLAAYL